MGEVLVTYSHQMYRLQNTLGNGTGAAVTATVGAAGTITGFTVNNGGTNYTQASPPLVFIDAPSPYKNLSMTGGSGIGAKMDVVVGTGGSIVDFKIADRGIGYKVDDVLTYRVCHLIQLVLGLLHSKSLFAISIRTSLLGHLVNYLSWMTSAII